LNWNKWIRQTHRWPSMAFTVAVIVNIVAVVQGRYNSRLGLLAVFPLALLLLTGLYLSCCRTPPSGAAGDERTERART
jgi:heme A synthase